LTLLDIKNLIQPVGFGVIICSYV